jgi:hypothetical protein
MTDTGKHIPCDCHDCTQARWRSTLAGQIQTSMASTNFTLGICKGWSHPHQRTDICENWQPVKHTPEVDNG